MVERQGIRYDEYYVYCEGNMTKNKIRRWIVMDSPYLVKRYLGLFHSKWFVEWTLFYVLEDELRNEINSEIIKELMK